MRIVIIGGHGKVARRLAPLLAAEGHEVSSLIRNADHAADVEAARARPVVADVEHLDVEALGARLTGHDALVWSAGAGGGNAARTYAVDRDAAIRSMDAAAAVGVRRYVMVSYFNARLDHGLAAGDRFYAYAEAKAAADAHLQESDLDWTILGPSLLTDDPGTGLIEVGDEIAASQVPRDDVARVVAAVLERPATARAFIRFNGGSTPIPEALAAFEH